MADDDALYDNPKSPKSDKYATKLGAEDEAGYQSWRKTMNDKAGRDIESDDYDMRGFYKDPDRKQGANGHFPDTYKKPSHPTFSDESKHHGKNGNEGGHWTESDDGKWSFKPGKTNIKNGLDKTRQYLKDNDPDVTLLDSAEPE